MRIQFADPGADPRSKIQVRIEMPFFPDLFADPGADPLILPVIVVTMLARIASNRYLALDPDPLRAWNFYFVLDPDPLRAWNFYIVLDPDPHGTCTIIRCKVLVSNDGPIPLPY